MRSANDVATGRRVGLALALANLRYWPTVAPLVRRELRQWERHAEAIPNPALRAQALAKLRDEHFNAQVAATLATLAGRRYRADVTSAIVAFQVMYDYLDGVSEDPVPDPLSDGHQLFRAFTVALTPGAPPLDWYRHHSQHGDGGYLDQLVGTCRRALEQLPSAKAVVAVARRVAAGCAEAQTLAHAIRLHGAGPLRRWSAGRTRGTDLTWWEYAAGAAASSLTIHALFAAAAHPATTPHEAAAIASAYLSICALSTLLDSLADHDDDVRNGTHRYVDYYADQDVAGERIVAVARSARLAVRSLRSAPHHAMTVAGVAGYYLTTPGAGSDFATPVATRVARELRPLISPVIVIFRIWRAVKRARRLDTLHAVSSLVCRRRSRDASRRLALRRRFAYGRLWMALSAATGSRAGRSCARRRRRPRRAR